MSEQEQTQALGFYERIQNPLKAADRMGEWLSKSGLFGCEKVEQGKVFALACLSMRTDPLEIARKYHLIEGRLSMRADAMQALFQADGGKVRWIKSTNAECEAEFSHDKYGSVQIALTMADLERAGITSGKDGKKKANYAKFPRQMLRARIVTEAIRMLHPGIVTGVYSEEEIEDIPKTGPGTAPELDLKPVEVKIKESEPESKPEKSAGKKAETKQQETKQEETKQKETKQEETKQESAEEPPKEESLIDEICKGNESACLAWLVSKGWLAKGQGLSDLKKEHIEKIAAAPSRFLLAVQKAAEKKR